MRAGVVVMDAVGKAVWMGLLLLRVVGGGCMVVGGGVWRGVVGACGKDLRGEQVPELSAHLHTRYNPPKLYSSTAMSTNIQNDFETCFVLSCTNQS